MPFPPELLELFLQANLTLGETYNLSCVGSTMRRMLVAGADRQWRPKLEVVHLSERQFGVRVSGGVQSWDYHTKFHHQGSGPDLSCWITVMPSRSSSRRRP